MDAKTVTALRKEGKIEEALALANDLLAKDAQNIWNKRAIAWVFHDYLKLYSTSSNYDNFLSYIIKIKELELPHDETMVFDASAYQIGKILFDLARQEKVELHKVTILFNHVKDFHFSKPSEAYSFLFRGFHKFHHTWTNYLPFAEWWGLENFMPKDFQSEMYNDRNIMALAEQAYIAYSKKLLEGEDKLQKEGVVEKGINTDKITEFLPKIDTLIESYPEYQYPPYFKAKLLLALGSNENILSSFMPFAKRKRNDFWVWELLSETFPEGDERKMACLCKALSLNSKDEFLINTRQKLVIMLIEKQQYPEAKYEISKIIETRQEKGWKIPSQISNWTNQDWYLNTNQNQNNSKFYDQFIGIAEGVLFSDIPEVTIAIEFVNQNKMVANFVKDEGLNGYFAYRNLIKRPQIGEVYKVRLEGAPKSKSYKLLTAKRMPKGSKCDAIKSFKGSLKLFAPQNFGIVNGVFIEPRLVEKYRLQTGDTIHGLGILSFNKKRNEWGWKALTVEK